MVIWSRFWGEQAGGTTAASATSTAGGGNSGIATGEIEALGALHQPCSVVLQQCGSLGLGDYGQSSFVHCFWASLPVVRGPGEVGLGEGKTL